jgi:hypothetical protein
MSNPSGPSGPSQQSSRTPSTASQSRVRQHAPTGPSHLRETYEPPPTPLDRRQSASETSFSPGAYPVKVDDSGIEPLNEGSSTADDPRSAMGIEEQPDEDARTHLLHQHPYDYTAAHEGDCNHGTFSPRPGTRNTQTSFDSSHSRHRFGGRYPGELGKGVAGSSSNTHGLIGDAFADGILGPGDGKKMSTTQWLAKRHGVKNTRLMSVFLNTYTKSF